jgi:hypothetical protein
MTKNTRILTDLDRTLNKREEQLRRLLKAHALMPREQSIAIILGWMSIDDVEAMLKLQER